MKKVMLIVISAILVISCALGMTACSQGTPAAVGAKQIDSAAHTAKLPATVKGTGYVEKAQPAAAITTTAAATDDNAAKQADDENGVISYIPDMDEIHSNYRSNSPAFVAMYDTIQNSGANSYVICNIAGTNSEALVLSYGEAELDRYYEVYAIGTDGITYLGMIGGSHTTAYIDNMMGTLCLFNANMGSYAYGAVWADGGLRVEYNDYGYVEAGESYPELPGTPVSFYAATDFSGIMMY
ncbi:MAG: hypothetical protein IJ639_10940 [Ruminococcus sp.]|nr:hypothetical protein [Ruminococcus sp.]